MTPGATDARDAPGAGRPLCKGKTSATLARAAPCKGKARRNGCPRRFGLTAAPFDATKARRNGPRATPLQVEIPAQRVCATPRGAGWPLCKDKTAQRPPASPLFKGKTSATAPRHTLARDDARRNGCARRFGALVGPFAREKPAQRSPAPPLARGKPGATDARDASVSRRPLSMRQRPGATAPAPHPCKWKFRRNGCARHLVALDGPFVRIKPRKGLPRHPFSREKPAQRPRATPLQGMTPGATDVRAVSGRWLAPLQGKNRRNGPAPPPCKG